MKGMGSAFRSLRVHNFRLYFAGQVISFTGTWMQRLAQEWLVLELTGSGAWLGTVAALQFLPILLLAPWAGILVDRVEKRRMIMWCQSLSGLLALLLGVVVALNVVTLWMVCVLALALGALMAADNPARHSFVMEMVGQDELHSAVSLNSVVVNSARAVGPAVAGLMIVTWGLAPTFFVNAASYAAVVVALLLMDRAALHPATLLARGPGQLLEGLRHVRRSPVLWPTLVLAGVVCMFAWQFAVTLPLLAAFTFDGDAGTLGAMNAALGIGAVAGGLTAARRARPDLQVLAVRTLLFGVMLVVTALAPSLVIALGCLTLAGAMGVQFISMANGLLQLHAGDAYRGRVMSLWAIAVFGTTPIGGPVVGWLSQAVGPRAGLALGGVTTVLVAAWVRSVTRPESSAAVAQT